MPYKGFLQFFQTFSALSDKLGSLEAVNSQIKLFNGVSGWRNITTLLAYLQGYTIGYSFFRETQMFK